MIKQQFELEVGMSMATKGPKVRPGTTITSTSSASNTPYYPSTSVPHILQVILQPAFHLTRTEVCIRVRHLLAVYTELQFEDAWNMKNCRQMIATEASCLLDLSRRNDSSSLITGRIFHVP
jgi:hypothetical protein